MTEQAHTFTVGEDGLRLDKFLVTCLPDFSRSRLQALIREGHVLVDGQVPVKSGMALSAGQAISIVIPPPAPSALTPENIPLDIVFENGDLLVVNKPAGMVVHPAAGHSSGTLVHAVLGYDPEMEGVGGEQRPGIVHRLDKDTSGLILMAKNDRTHRWLQDQFRLRKVTKVYLALVDGHPPTPEGRIEAPIGRDPNNRMRMGIVPIEKGREAVTEYHSLQRFRLHELLEAHPITGRTHQIRVHLAFLGCPIVGDTFYGHRHASLPIKRHFLHAQRITITLPGEDSTRTFEAPLPADLREVLAALE